MKSMTGYGRGESLVEGYKAVVEIVSVNRKQGEVFVNLARDLDALEPRIRDFVNQSVARGRVTVKVLVKPSEQSQAGRVHLNQPLAAAYVRELRRLAGELKLDAQISLDTLARIPGVLQIEEDATDPERYWKVVQPALEKALNQMIKLREREGNHLSRELKRLVVGMRRTLKRVRGQAPQVVQRYREQLRQRIRMAELEAPDPKDERLLRELVYFSDRSDITEELTRLDSHFNQFDEVAKSPEPVGRMLDFLAQEMNREINTIGSKANDGAISQAVVALKTELEKFREQAQNVE